MFVFAAYRHYLCYYRVQHLRVSIVMVLIIFPILHHCDQLGQYLPDLPVRQLLPTPASTQLMLKIASLLLFHLNILQRNLKQLYIANIIQHFCHRQDSERLALQINLIMFFRLQQILPEISQPTKRTPRQHLLIDSSPQHPHRNPSLEDHNADPHATVLDLAGLKGEVVLLADLDEFAVHVKRINYYGYDEDGRIIVWGSIIRVLLLAGLSGGGRLRLARGCKLGAVRSTLGRATELRNPFLRYNRYCR